MWIRLRQVALVAAELAPVLDDLHDVLGLEVAYRDPGVATFGLENAVLPVGTQFLEVVAPTKEGTAAGRHLQRRGGDGGYMVITHTDDHERRRQRVADLGIRKVLEFNEHDYHCMQLHPSDTGGSFFEIDFQAGGEDPKGPWAPAGPKWQDAVSADVVNGITGVEVQAVDAAGVAQRWSDIVEIDLEGGGGGEGGGGQGGQGDGRNGEDFVLPFDNAEVRFVTATDGRGDGLRGVLLNAVDWAGALDRAKRRGLPIEDDVITICGTRFAPSAG